MAYLSDIDDTDGIGREKHPKPDLFQAVRVGLMAAFFAFLWQWTTVTYNYRGEWSALFYTGSTSRMPADLEFEQTYTIARSPGYDGQFYHLIAHDPFLARGFDRHIDNPRLRWRRILLPLLAWAFAFGRDEGIDAGLFGVTLGFVALGATWLALYCASHGLDASWGLLFLLIPGTLVSLDRMTIDVGLVALCAGFALYSLEKQPTAALMAVLVMAPLTRETGVCLTGGYLLWTLLQRMWTRALLTVATLAPFALWTAFVHANTAADLTKWTGVPLMGLVLRTLKPVQYALTSSWVKQAAVLDYIAIIGIWMALILLMQLMLNRRAGPLDLATLAFGAMAALVSKPDIWSEAYAFARTQSPLLFCLLLAGIPLHFWASGVPLALCIPRILFQLTPQFYGILHSWMGKR